MLKTDVNCLIGHWPFRKIYKNTFDDLIKVHEANNIFSGYIASLNSIFYNDPFEGDEELHEIIKDTQYHHVLTVNPALPGFIDDVQRGINLFNIKGVRIYPGYHGYNLEDERLQALCRELVKVNLPLFLVLRMEDERLNYLISPRSIPMDEVIRFAQQNKDLNIILINIRLSEINGIMNVIANNENVYFDTCGLKDGLFTINNLVSLIGDKKMLYGSLYPLYALKSTELLIEKAAISDESKENIFYNNVTAIFK
jgi:predicted TIM-barrel fold metal-dependent hydrolase